MGMLRVLGLLCCCLSLQLFAAKPLSIILDWYPNPDHAALLYADAAGYFTREGVDVKLIAPSDPTLGVKMVAAGQADLAVTYQPSYVLAQRQQLGITWIATLVAQPLASMVVLDKGPITTLAALKGKTLGLSSPGIDALMAQLMLQHVGLTLKDVHMLVVPNSLTASLISGRVDAIQGAMRNVEPFVFAAQGIKVKQFFPEDYGFPAYDELIIVASKKQAHNPQYALMIDALTKATKALKANPTAAWQVVIHKYPALNTEVNQQSWQATVPLLDSTPGYYDAKRYKTLAVFMNEKQNNIFFYE